MNIDDQKELAHSMFVDMFVIATSTTKIGSLSAEEACNISATAVCHLLGAFVAGTSNRNNTMDNLLKKIFESSKNLALHYRDGYKDAAQKQPMADIMSQEARRAIHE